MRTGEQIAADAALTEAIERVRAAYNDPGDAEWLLTDYLVIYAAQRFGPDGEGWTMVGSVYRDDDVPGYRLLGLIEFAAARVRALINTPAD